MVVAWVRERRSKIKADRPDEDNDWEVEKPEEETVRSSCWARWALMRESIWDVAAERLDLLPTWGFLGLEVSSSELSLAESTPIVVERLVLELTRARSAWMDWRTLVGSCWA